MSDFARSGSIGTGVWEAIVAVGRFASSAKSFAWPAVLLAGLLWLMDSWSAGAAQEAEENVAALLADKHATGGAACSACHEENPPSEAPPTPKCLLCHGSYDKVAQKTKEAAPNPHASHMGEIPCVNCHHMHKASESYCAQCHDFSFEVP